MSGMLSAHTLLAAISLRGFGRKTVIKLFDEFPPSDLDVQSPGTLHSLIATNIGRIPRLRVPDLSEIIAAYDQAEMVIEKSSSQKVQSIGLFDKNYPSRLKKTPDPPAVLFVKGDLSALSRPLAIAVIGTREPSEYGSKAAFKIGARLAQLGATVVSGLALGCDTEGHLGCLSENGIAIGVLAHGLDMVQPAASRPLAEQVLDTKGCLVSEYVIGTSPRRNSFVERDRIQSGLSDAVFVVETALKGGSMHTVKFCEEQGRQLACLVHPLEHANHPKAEGCANLINSGRAKPIANKEDLADLLKTLTDGNDPAHHLETKVAPVQGSFEF